MHGGGVHAVELVFLSLLAFVVLFAAVARKLNLPYPIVLLLAGLLLSFLPRVPKVTLNPDVIFLIVLPPLLYSAAWVTSWRDFRFNLFSIFMLAFGLERSRYSEWLLRRRLSLRASRGNWASCWAQWCHPPTQSRPRPSPEPRRCRGASRDLATRCHLHGGRSALSGSRISERRRVDQEPSSGHALPAKAIMPSSGARFGS